MDSTLHVTTLALSWGLITQCLEWAGVIAWGWIAVWLPLCISLVLAFVAALIVAIWGD